MPISRTSCHDRTHSHLEEVKRQPHVAKHGRVVRAERNVDAVIDEDREWMRGHRGCKSLPCLIW